MSINVFRSLLNNTFLLASPRRTTDGQGGWVIDYVDEGSTVGRVRPAGGSEERRAYEDTWRISHVLYVEAPSPIGRGWRVTLSDLILYVDGVREPSQAGHHLEIDCFQRQEEVGQESGS